MSVPPEFDGRKFATRKWKQAEWVTGHGRIALLAHCRVLTITLHATMEKALLSKKQIDEHTCGGRCCRHHEIVDLATLVKGPQP